MKIDVQLIQALKKRDEQAYTMVYEQYKNLVFYVALKIVHQNDLAEEVLNDTFYALYKHIDTFDEDRVQDFQAWLMKIAKNKALDAIKHRKDLIYDDELIQNIPEKEDEPLENDFDSMMKLFQHYLDQQEIDIILYRIYYNYSFKEIAEFMKLPLSTISSKYARALKKVKKQLKEQQYESNR
jgi:RNA polymerase sigma-70 factor, ECF subfamily